MATTSWPTWRRSASPSVAGVEVVGRDPEHGEVGEPIGADDVEVELATVDERRRSAVRSVDDVRRREHVAVGRH